MASHKNRFTILGPIGIVVFLFIAVVFLYKPVSGQTEYCMPLAAWGKDTDLVMGFYHKPDRNYTTIQLHGNAARNKTPLRVLRGDVKKMIAQKDTVNGLHLHLNNNMDYQTFIDFATLMEEENIRLWTFTDRDIWIYNLSAHEHKYAKECFKKYNTLLWHK